MQDKIVIIIKKYSIAMAYFLGHLDELTILVFLPVALMKIFINKEYPTRLYIMLLSPIIFFIIGGLVSKLVNGNSFIVTVIGISSYMEYFVIIFIYAAFFNTNDEFKMLFSVLLKVALILAVIALIQEFSALISRYILKLDMHDTSSWRLGVYRPESLLKSTNIFGLYILLIFAIYINIAKRVNNLIFVILLSGIILSMSRVVYTGLIFLCIALIYRGKRSFMFLLIPMLTLLLMAQFYKDIDSNKDSSLNGQIEQETSGYIEWRTVTKRNAITIWKDHIFFGAGPGMYGGEISLKYNSMIYIDYPVPDNIMWHLRRTGHMDQFWFQLLAEMGIVGATTFSLFFVALIIVLLILRIFSPSLDTGNLFIGLLIMTMIIIIFSLYTGLLNKSLIFSYSAILGMAIGSEKEKYKQFINFL